MLRRHDYRSLQPKHNQKMKNLVLTLTAVILSCSVSMAQKMAHADISAILSVMPENEKINNDLKIYATGLSKSVEDQRAQIDGLVEQFNRTLQAGDTAAAVKLQQQGLEMDKKLQETSAAAERQLAQKRSELLQPVLARIKSAMEAVAKKKGFDYVLNSVDGAGTSIVLWGPDGTDITRAVVDELGIKLEAQQEAPTNNKGKK